jgi:glycosyltransferase involved in cell wall biosynthesis
MAGAMAEGEPPLHVVVVNYAYDADLASAEEALARYFVLTGWAASLLATGARVTVAGRLGQDARIEREGATYHFLADGHAPWLRGWQVPHRLHHLVRACCAEATARGEVSVVHVNGLLFPLATRHLAASLPSTGMPGRRPALIAQHHAEAPWPGPAAWLQRWGLSPVDGFFFAARALADEWVRQGSIRCLDRVHEVMVASSPFRCEERATARQRTGLRGDPVVLWTGNLNANKDPLTILAGFERILERLPRARLYMAYRCADLLPQVQACIAAGERLRAAVRLLGTIPHAEVESYYNSADFFVQGSAREAGGLALLDAMACGTVPVVTGIPSFRVMTGGGRTGALWPPGDVDGFVQAFLDLAARPLAPLSRQVREHFEETWSAAAIGRRAVAAYRQISLRRSGVPREKAVR